MFETVSAGDSWVRRLDPRIKILAVGLFSIFLALSYRFTVLVSGLAIALILAFASRISCKEFLNRLVPVNIFMLFLWVFLPFTYAGTPVYSVWMLTITREGLTYAAAITIKSNALMVMLILLVSSTSIFTLGNAMHRLGVPIKLVQLFFFTYRYIHVIYQEYIRLLNAMKIRGFIPKTNLHTYKSYAYMVGMILVKSSERARRVQQAMRCRGFNGKFYCLSELSLERSDLTALAVMMLILAVLGIIEWTTILV